MKKKIRRPNGFFHGVAGKSLSTAVFLTLSIAALILITTPVPLSALPSGPHHVQGARVNAPSGGQMAIDQHDSRAIVNWQDFSIAAGEHVRFNQPRADASILNRVTGGNLSEIHGRLSANGQVLLLNPHGVLVGPSGMIDANSFIASTLDLDDADFLDGDDIHFYSPDSQNPIKGTITNLGRISANGGNLVLISTRVENAGELSADKGKVSIAAGYDEILLTDTENPKLLVRLESGEWGNPEDAEPVEKEADGSAKTTAENTGRIEAVRVEIAAHNNNPYALAINNEGAIAATGTETIDGEVWLTAPGEEIKNEGRIEGASKVQVDAGAFVNAGTVSADRPEDGGDISISADWLSAGDISANGGSSGGTVTLDAENLILGGTVSAQGNEAGGTIVMHSTTRSLEVNSSLVSASGGEQGGQIRHVSEGGLMSSGRYDASSMSGRGGRIDLTGESVNLLSAVFDASGSTRGGLVRIGGAFRGGKKTDAGGGVETGEDDARKEQFVTRWGNLDALENAGTTYISNGSRIDVSASGSEGGTAIVWSDERTRFAGAIDARGPASGGTVEISAANELQHTDLSNVRIGTGGELLLDPKDITVSADGGATGWAQEAIFGYGYDGPKDLNITELSMTDFYGEALSLDGDGNRLAVGADWADGFGNSTNESGEVYLYTFSDTSFSGVSLAATIGKGYSGGNNIDLSILNFSSYFGVSVSLDNDGDRLAVATAYDHVHLFTFTDTSFGGGSLHSTLNSVGRAVSLNSNGDRLAIGNSNAGTGGEVYLYTFSDIDFSNPTMVKTVGGSQDVDVAELESGDRFGVSVSLNDNGDRLAVGARGDDGFAEIVPFGGAVYLFSFSDTDFNGGVLEAMLGPGYSWGKNVDVTNIETGDFFGWSVSLDGDGDLLAVGAKGGDGSGNVASNSGEVYLFSFTDAAFSGGNVSAMLGKGYTGGSNVDVSNVGPGDSFGGSASNNGGGCVSLISDGSRLAVGSSGGLGKDDTGPSGAGEVYLFSLSGSASLADNDEFSENSTLPQSLFASDIEAQLNAGTAVTLQANNDITVSSPIVANNAGGDGGALTLQAGRDIAIEESISTDNGNLIVKANETAVNGVVDAQRDAGPADITLASGKSIDAGSGTVTLQVLDGTGVTNAEKGAVTLTGNITAANLRLIGSDVTHTLTNASNSIGTVAADTGSVDLFTTGNLTAGSVSGTTGITTTGIASLLAGGDITLSNSVAGDGDNNAAAGANTVILSAGSNFINNAGGSGVTAGSGDWLIYSTTPAADTFGGLSSGNKAVWGKSHATYPPGSVTETGNRYLFSSTGAVTVTTTDGTTKTYDGSAAYPSNYNLSGPPVSAADYGNVFVNSAEFDIWSTAPTIAAASANAGTQTISASGGVANSGYSLTYSNLGQVTINPKALTISGSSVAGKTYDGNTTATVTPGSLSGLVGAETVTANATGAFTDKNVGINKNVTVAYTLGNGANGGLAVNYSLGGETLLAAILSKAISISGLTAADKIYDGLTSATISNWGTLNGVVPGDSVSLNSLGSSTAFADKHVGAGKTVTASSLALSGLDAANYAISNQTTTASILAKPLSLNGITAADKTYDGTTAATISDWSTLNGLISGDTVSLNTGGTTATFADKNVGTDKTVTAGPFTLSGVDAGNYSISNQTTLADILVKPLNLSGLTAADKIYDGTTAVTISNWGSLNGVLAGETVALNSDNAFASFADKNVATGKVVTVNALALSGTDAGNYAIGTPTATAVIQAKPVSISGVIADNKIYDGTTAATISHWGELSGTITGDSAAVDESNASATFEDKNVGANKTVTVTNMAISGADAGNYSLIDSTLTTLADILASAINIISVDGFVAEDKVYDGTTDASIIDWGDVTGIFTGDDVNVDHSNASAAFADKNAGADKTVTITSLALSGPDAVNYALSSSTFTTTADILAKELLLSGIVAEDKTYDGAVDAFISDWGSLNGIIGDDAVSLDTRAASAAFEDKNVGADKVVTTDALSLTGADAGNYSLSPNQTIDADITAKSVAIDNLIAGNKTYDGTTHAFIMDLGDLPGMIDGDGLVIDGSNASAVFEDKNVGTDKKVTVTDLALSGDDADNYELINSTLTTLADIYAQALNILSINGLVAENKVYDGTTDAVISYWGYLSGTVMGDSVSINSNNASAAFEDKNAGKEKTVTVTDLAVSGADAGNYELPNSTLTTVADILPKPLVLEDLAVDNKIYDGNTHATINSRGTLDGVIPGDSVELDLDALSAEFEDKNAGVNKTVIPGTLALTGADAGNYSIPGQVTATADILPKPLTLDNLIADNKTYDGATTATISDWGSLDGVITGDAIRLDYSVAAAAFTDKNAGKDKTVNVGPFKLTGTDAGNYTFSPQAAVTADIYPKPLETIAVNIDKIYDGTTIAAGTVTELYGLVGDETVSAMATGEFKDKYSGLQSAVVSYTLGDGPNGGLAMNYSIADEIVDGWIDKKELTLTGVIVDDKIYDGNTVATISDWGGLAGTIYSDSVFLDSAGASARFSDPEIGAEKTVTVDQLGLSGEDRQNYSFSDRFMTTGSIIKNPVIAAAEEAFQRYGSQIESLRQELLRRQSELLDTEQSLEENLDPSEINRLQRHFDRLHASIDPINAGIAFLEKEQFQQRLVFDDEFAARMKAEMEKARIATEDDLQTLEKTTTIINAIELAESIISNLEKQIEYFEITGDNEKVADLTQKLADVQKIADEYALEKKKNDILTQFKEKLKVLAAAKEKNNNIVTKYNQLCEKIPSLSGIRLMIDISKAAELKQDMEQAGREMLKARNEAKDLKARYESLSGADRLTIPAGNTIPATVLSEPYNFLEKLRMPGLTEHERYNLARSVPLDLLDAAQRNFVKQYEAKQAEMEARWLAQEQEEKALWEKRENDEKIRKLLPYFVGADPSDGKKQELIAILNKKNISIDLRKRAEERLAAAEDFQKERREEEAQQQRVAQNNETASGILDELEKHAYTASDYTGGDVLMARRKTKLQALVDSGELSWVVERRAREALEKITEMEKDFATWEKQRLQAIQKSQDIIADLETRKQGYQAALNDTNWRSWQLTPEARTALQNLLDAIDEQIAARKIYTQTTDNQMTSKHVFDFIKKDEAKTLSDADWDWMDGLNAKNTKNIDVLAAAKKKAADATETLREADGTNEQNRRTKEYVGYWISDLEAGRISQERIAELENSITPDIYSPFNKIFTRSDIIDNWRKYSPYKYKSLNHRVREAIIAEAIETENANSKKYAERYRAEVFDILPHGYGIDKQWDMLFHDELDEVSELIRQEIAVERSINDATDAVALAYTKLQAIIIKNHEAKYGTEEEQAQLKEEWEQASQDLKKVQEKLRSETANRNIVQDAKKNVLREIERQARWVKDWDDRQRSLFDKSQETEQELIAAKRQFSLGFPIPGEIYPASFKEKYGDKLSNRVYNLPDNELRTLINRVEVYFQEPDSETNALAETEQALIEERLELEQKARKTYAKALQSPPFEPASALGEKARELERQANELDRKLASVRSRIEQKKSEAVDKVIAMANDVISFKENLAGDFPKLRDVTTASAFHYYEHPNALSEAFQSIAVQEASEEALREAMISNVDNAMEDKALEHKYEMQEYLVRKKAGAAKEHDKIIASAKSEVQEQQEAIKDIRRSRMQMENEAKDANKNYADKVAPLAEKLANYLDKKDSLLNRFFEGMLAPMMTDLLQMGQKYVQAVAVGGGSVDDILSITIPKLIERLKEPYALDAINDIEDPELRKIMNDIADVRLPEYPPDMYEGDRYGYDREDQLSEEMVPLVENFEATVNAKRAVMVFYDEGLDRNTTDGPDLEKIGENRERIGAILDHSAAKIPESAMDLILELHEKKAAREGSQGGGIRENLARINQEIGELNTQKDELMKLRDRQYNKDEKNAAIINPAKTKLEKAESELQKAQAELRDYEKMQETVRVDSMTNNQITDANETLKKLDTDMQAELEKKQQKVEELTKIQDTAMKEYNDALQQTEKTSSVNIEDIDDKIREIDVKILQLSSERIAAFDDALEKDSEQ